jgi:hypothetical protein
MRFRWRQVSPYCHFTTAELDIYLNVYGMCPQFAKGAGSGVPAPAIAVVQRLGYILGCMSWVNVWFYPAMCGLKEWAKNGKYYGYLSAGFYALSVWERPLMCYKMLPYLSDCSTKYVECEQNHTFSSSSPWQIYSLWASPEGKYYLRRRS